MTSVKVTIPATTANLGPGFDCLGLALGLYNEVTLDDVGEGLSIAIAGEGQDVLATDDGNLVVRAAESVFRRVGRRPRGLRIRQHNEIPVGSGLGSSAAATVGGILGANALVDGDLSMAEMLQLASDLEGHPDNTAAALFGGLILVVEVSGTFHVERIKIASMEIVVVLPGVELATADARAALPESVPLSDAVFNAGRVGLLVRALEEGDYRKLGMAVQDRLHEQYRIPLIPGMNAAFEAAKETGAVAVALSGAGPSLVAFADRNHERIMGAICHAFRQAGIECRSWLLPVDFHGSRMRQHEESRRS